MMTVINDGAVMQIIFAFCSLVTCTHHTCTSRKLPYIQTHSLFPIITVTLLCGIMTGYSLHLPVFIVI